MLRGCRSSVEMGALMVVVDEVGIEAGKGGVARDAFVVHECQW